MRLRQDSAAGIVARVLRVTERFPGTEAIVDGPVRISYAGLQREMLLSTRAAMAAGIGPGDRAAIWAPNGYRWMIAALGILGAGAAIVPLSSRFKGGEAAHVLAKARPRTLFSVSGFLGYDYPAMLRDWLAAQPLAAQPLAAQPLAPFDVVLLEGLPWRWTTFAQYLDAVEALPKALNIAAQCGHSAVRASVMGERAFTDEATADEVAATRQVVAEAIAAGAIGFSTSRRKAHLTKAGDPVASRIASWAEVSAIVSGMGELAAGIFQLAPERPADPADIADYQARLGALAASSGRPVTVMVGGQQEQLDAVDRVRASGGAAIGQVHVRGFENVFGFRTTLPFDRLPLWREIRALPLDEQRARLRDPELRARLVTEAESGSYGEAVGAEVRAPRFDQIMIIDPAAHQERSVAELARERGTSPVDVLIDQSLSSGFEQLFRQPINEIPRDLVLDGLRHPHAVVAASDSGAHISQILDSNIPTYLLSHWVRDESAFTWAQAVRMLTSVPAAVWDLDHRGVLEPGAFADVVVFDPTIGCAAPTVRNDLPDGGPRLAQSATGIDAVLVNGHLTTTEGHPTGATPGTLLRSPPHPP